jgi:hypothetical protein
MAHKDPAMLGAVSYPKQPLDSYMTERWVTEWLIDALKPSWPSSWASYGTVPGGVVWEPACGTGLMAEVLVERGYDVLATDIHDYGYFLPRDLRQPAPIQGYLVAGRGLRFDQ